MDLRPHDQGGFDVRFDWGLAGLHNLAAGVATAVIVDVLSFSTCVDVATERGAAVLPFAGGSEDAARYAADHDACLASRRGDGRWTLSPASLLDIPAGTRLVLPSPNGSSLSKAAADLGLEVLAGCLRNAAAVGRRAGAAHGPIGVVAAGERWGIGAGGLRPALEDLIGAGAVISTLDGSRSPEAAAAAAVFASVESSLEASVAESASGRELSAAGFGEDVRIATQLDAGGSAPVLVGPAYRADA